jgi:AraC-like DNA-binding protein
MIVVGEGSQSVRTTGGTHMAGVGDVLFYRAGCAHEEDAEAGQQFASHFIAFTWPEAPDGIPVLLPDRRGRIRVLVKWLNQEREMQSPVTRAVMHSLLQAILTEALHLWKHPEDELVARLRGHMVRRLRDAVTLDDLAAIACMSRFHVIRKYKALTGVTPMEDLRRIRVQRANELIMTTNHPIKAIAEEVGFANVFHFSRVFKRFMGVPPGSLRQRGG